MPRWLTFEPGLADEERARADLIGRMGHWWQAFTARATAIDRLFRQKEEWDLVGWMRENLQSIDDALCWEFGSGIPAGHRLVITPESSRWLRPLVDHLLSVAPTVPGWQFHGWRLAEGLEDTRATVEARTGSPWSARGCRLAAGEGNHIDVVFTHPRADLRRDPDLTHKQAFVAAETLFGEHALDQWVGSIESDEASDGDLPLATIGKAFEGMRKQILATLPTALCLERADACEWTGWKLKPEKQADYEDQDDLFFASSMYPEMWMTTRRNGIFSSARFSSRETFCYLKLDGKEGIDQEVFPDKAAIEDALDAALVPRRLGCHIGGGSGLRYSYLDLALTDWARALPVIRDVLRQGRVPKRSWLLFYDSDWMHEWCGIYPDSPVPPGLR